MLPDKSATKKITFLQKFIETSIYSFNIGI